MLPLIAQSGDWELDEAILFRAHLRPRMTVVDIGAHVGYYALLAARAVGRFGRVLAVEPHPVNAQLLRRNLARNEVRNVEVIEAAAGRKSGKLLLAQNQEQNTGVQADFDGWKPRWYVELAERMPGGFGASSCVLSAGLDTEQAFAYDANICSRRLSCF